MKFSGAMLATLALGLSWVPRVHAEGKLLPSQCEGASKELLGLPAVRLGSGKPRLSEPKLLSRVLPKLPAEWPKECRGSVTVIEALVGTSGKVERAWVLRSPCKEVEQAGVDAIRQWVYEPLRLEGKPVPFCVIVSSLVHLR